jgi:hypothetical protein
VAWDQRSYPEFTDCFEQFGVTVRDRNDLPSSLQAYLDANQLWYNGQETTEQRHDPIANDPYPNDPRPLTELWDSYLGLSDAAALDNYRWVTIEDGQALCQRLTVPFVLCELVVPAKLQIEDATWTELESYTKTGTFYPSSAYTWVPSRAVGLVAAAEEGDWVFDPDTYVPDTWYSNRNVPIIRAEVEPVDYCWSWLWTWAANGSSQTGLLAAADYGPLNRRLRSDTCPLTPVATSASQPGVSLPPLWFGSGAGGSVAAQLRRLRTQLRQQHRAGMGERRQQRSRSFGETRPYSADRAPYRGPGAAGSGDSPGRSRQPRG